MCADLYVQTCSSLILVFKLFELLKVFVFEPLKESPSVQENVVYVPLSRDSTYKKATSSHMFSWSFLVQVQLSSSLPVNVLLTASPC